MDSGSVAAMSLLAEREALKLKLQSIQDVCPEPAEHCHPATSVAKGYVDVYGPQVRFPVPCSRTNLHLFMFHDFQRLVRDP